MVVSCPKKAGRTAAGAEEALTLPELTGLDEMTEKLSRGAAIDRVYYTDGYGFSTSEFTTQDPETIARLWEAVNQITVEGPARGGITDWYPQIVFFLSDGGVYRVCFNAHWLEIGGMDNYEISHAETFWCLTRSLVVTE